MKRLTLLIAFIFLISDAGCIPFKRVNKISKMALSDLNIRAVNKDKELFDNCTLYRIDESFNVSSYDNALYEDGDGTLYFYYESLCHFHFSILVMTQKKKITRKMITLHHKEEEIENNLEIPLIYLESEDLKAFSADRAFFLNARIKDRHHQKKCDVGIGDIEFEFIEAKNIFYLLSLLNENDKKSMIHQIPDNQLTYLVEDNFDDIEDIVKVANANTEFKEKLYNITKRSEKIKNKFRTMYDSEIADFTSRIDSPEYVSVILSMIKGM
jgi:hypothetical protein